MVFSNDHYISLLRLELSQNSNEATFYNGVFNFCN